MDLELIEKIVEYHKYCKTCEYEELAECDDPCHECLSNPTNRHTTKPVCYKADEKKLAKEQAKKIENNEENNEQ